MNIEQIIEVALWVEFNDKWEGEKYIEKRTKIYFKKFPIHSFLKVVPNKSLVEFSASLAGVITSKKYVLRPDPIKFGVYVEILTVNVKATIGPIENNGPFETEILSEGWNLGFRKD